MKENRIRENWLQWLLSNSRGWRILTGAICVIALTLFLHFRETRFEVLDLNTKSSRYIVAQIDFEYPDFETTLVLRQQAMQDVGKLYKLDPSEVKNARRYIEDFLIGNKQWRSTFSTCTFEEMYKALEVTEEKLLDLRFTDPRTIRKIKETSIPSFANLIFLEQDSADQEVLNAKFWKTFLAIVLEDRELQQDAVGYVCQQYHSQPLTIIDDTASENILKLQVAQVIPEKLIKVQAGTRIIDIGETITTRHLTMMQAMKLAIAENQNLSGPLSWLASFIISFIFVLISTLYFRISQVEFIRNIRKVSLFVCIIIMTLILAKVTEYIMLKSSSFVISEVRYPIVAPFATILICILLSPRTALFAATFLSIILSINLAVDHGRFLILNLVASIAMIIFSQKLRRRKEVFAVSLKATISVIPVLYAYILADNRLWSASLLVDVSSTFFFLMMTAVLVIGILPALETIFGVLTDMSLVEYMDPNNELLRDFSSLVPGTYQHSLVLGNLAETCARAIGANGLFCRAATLYHDLGKMNNPQFYTENQQNQVNIHQLLTPLESAQVIISHVADGVEIAKKHKLPESFIDIIKEHHGTTLVYYFYRKELERQGGNVELVHENDFRYPGPKPHSKESAIIMICDSIEAASRSIDDSSESAVREMVNSIIAQKAEDGQFDESQLTFEELSLIKKALVKALLLTHHVRIKYPKRK